MSRKKLTVSYLLLIALGIVGAWLVGLFEGDRPARDVSGGEVLLAVLGFFMSLGAIVGIFVLISRNRRPMNQEQRVVWEQVRAQGKKRYIGNYVLRGSLITLVSFSFPLLKNYWAGKSISDDLGIYAALSLICVGGVYYAAVRTWSYYEWEYHNKTSPEVKSY